MCKNGKRGILLSSCRNLSLFCNHAPYLLRIGRCVGKGVCTANGRASHLVGEAHLRHGEGGQAAPHDGVRLADWLVSLSQLSSSWVENEANMFDNLDSLLQTARVSRHACSTHERGPECLGHGP